MSIHYVSFPTELSARASACLLALGLSSLAGCGSGVSVRPEPTEFTVKVTSGGKPVSGINLGLSPLDDGLPCGIVLKDGTGSAKAIPGRYMYFAALGDAKGAEQIKAATAVLKAIPSSTTNPTPTATSPSPAAPRSKSSSIRTPVIDAWHRELKAHRLRPVGQIQGTSTPSDMRSRLLADKPIACHHAVQE